MLRHSDSALVENNICENWASARRDTALNTCARRHFPDFHWLRRGSPSPFDHTLGMNTIVPVLRLVHIIGGVYWAGTMFFFVTFLEPTLRSLGPDGGKVMIRLFERGYMKILPIVAMVTVLAGLWLLWILSAGFQPAYMRSPLGIGFSTGGTLAIIALIIGLVVMRPVGARIWAIALQLPQESNEASRAALMAEMGKLRERTLLAARAIFGLLVGAVALMAVSRYL